MFYSFAECVGPSFSENIESHCALFNFQSNGLQGLELQSDFFYKESGEWHTRREWKIGKEIYSMSLSLLMHFFFGVERTLAE